MNKNFTLHQGWHKSEVNEQTRVQNVRQQWPSGLCNPSGVSTSSTCARALRWPHLSWPCFLWKHHLRWFSPDRHPCALQKFLSHIWAPGKGLTLKLGEILYSTVFLPEKPRLPLSPSRGFWETLKLGEATKWTVATVTKKVVSVFSVSSLWGALRTKVFPLNITIWLSKCSSFGDGVCIILV